MYKIFNTVDEVAYYTAQRVLEKAKTKPHAITLGVQDILEAKEVLLVATGKNKANIMAELYSCEINEALPASALKRHKNVTYVLDAEAASSLAKTCTGNL